MLGFVIAITDFLLKKYGYSY